METLTIRRFWKLYSKNQFEYEAIHELPKVLSYGVFFDQLFGKLTRHKFRKIENHKITIECLNCQYVLHEKKDVCETHIGILQGQFEKKLRSKFSPLKTVIDNTCMLNFKAKDGE